MNSSKEHNNWISIGEVLRLVRTPLVLYIAEIIESWHEKLRQHCFHLGQCTHPEICLKEKKAGKLCPSCLGWLRELEAHHRSNNKSQIKWRSNCETSKWPVDAWQAAKFFMSPLGDHKTSVTTAESTDLSSLLSVLERMTDETFGRGNGRIPVTLVRKLREVRNTWAHAPAQEATADQRNEAFKIAEEFLASLHKVYPHNSVETVMKAVQFLSTNGLTNVVEAELKALIMWRKELIGDVGRMKEEIKDLNENQSSDRTTIWDNEMKLRHVEECVEECVQQMLRFGREFESWRESLDNLYRDFQEMETFREETKRELSQMRGHIKKLQEISKKNDPDSTRESKLTSCIPEKTSEFVGREDVVKEILSLLERNTAIIALVGGPGFGKSTAAVHIAHDLNDLHKIPVFVSSVGGITSISEVTGRLCQVMGIHPQKDPKSSLIFWLRSVQEKAVLVIDSIEQLLEDETQEHFLELLSLLRMHSGGRLQIVLTSRRGFDISTPKVVCVSLKVLDELSSIKLVRSCCPQRELQDDCLTKLVNLCGCVPLALRIAASQLRVVHDPDELLQWLQQKPMKVLQTPALQKVENSIEMSFERLQEQEKTFFIRLSVFDGDFDRKAAEMVTELDGIETQNILSNLVNRSIVERRGERYSLHLLIRKFLVARTGFDSERKRAEEMMVEYFLKVCHSLTYKYWSRDGFCEARDLLQKDAHNVEKVFQLCQQGLGTTTSNPRIVEILRQSLIYQSALRFFYHFIVHLLSQRAVSSFLEACAEAARRNSDVDVEVVAMCQRTHLVGRERGWKSAEYITNMELIKDTFENRALKGDIMAEARCNYYYNRCLSARRSPSSNEELFKEATTFCSNLRKDVKKAEGLSVLEKVDVPITLWQLGKINEICHSWTNAAECFKEALSLVKKSGLGNHDFTLCCYKALGDLCLEQEKYEEALVFYDQAKKIQQNLGAANSNVSSVYLLVNCGDCLKHLHGFEGASSNRIEEAYCHLMEARDSVEKLPADNSRCKAKISQVLEEIEYVRNKEV